MQDTDMIPPSTPKTSTIKKKTGYQVFFSRRYLELNSIPSITTPPPTFSELSKQISQEWNQLPNDHKLDFHNLSTCTSTSDLPVNEVVDGLVKSPFPSRREELMQMRVKPDLYKLCEKYKLTKTGNKSMVVEKILQVEGELVEKKNKKDEIEIVDSKEIEEKEIFMCLKQHLQNKLRTKNPLDSSDSSNLNRIDPSNHHSKIRRLHIPRLQINTVPFEPSSLSILLQEAVNDSLQNNHSGNPGFSKTVVRRLENNKNIIQNIQNIQNIEEDDLDDHIDIGCEHDEHGTYVGLVEEEDAMDGINGINGIKKKKLLSEEEELVDDPDGVEEDPEGGDPDDPDDPEDRDEDPDNEEDEDELENDDLGELEDPEDVPLEDDDLSLIPETEDVFM
jgi:hypothetical protein